MTTETTQLPQLHIRFEGESIDVDLGNVDLGDMSTDQDVRDAASTHLEVPVSKFSSFIVDRNKETGDLTLRPQATFA